jgi:hypothetical protein
VDDGGIQEVRRFPMKILGHGVILSALAVLCSGCLRDDVIAKEPAAGSGDDGGDSSAHILAADAAVDAPSAAASCGSTPERLVDLYALAGQLDAGAVSAPPLAVNATTVYFLFGGALVRVPARGGQPVVVAPIGGYAEPNLLLTATSAIFVSIPSDSANARIVSVPLAGGAAVTLATTNGRLGGIATDGDGAYFVDSDGLKTVALAGGDVRLLTSQLTSTDVSDLAVVDNGVVVTEGSRGTVVRIPSQGGLLTTLATSQPNASFPLPCGADICWWSGATPQGPAGSSGPGNILRLGSAGKPTKIPGAPYLPWSLIFDGTDFYETVASDGSDGTLIRIPGAGGPPVSMTQGSFVAVDDVCAYFSHITQPEGIFSVIKSYGAAPR